MSTPLDLPGPWTFDDLAGAADDGRRYEVVDGALLVSPMETGFNEEVGLRLFRQLDRQAPSGWQAVLQSGIRLGRDGRVPDVGLVRSVLPVGRRQVGRPAEHYALVVEVVSPSSRKQDRFFKPLEYAAAGVPAFWRVETEPELYVVVHELVEGAYAVRQEVRGVEAVQVPFPLVLDVPALKPLIAP